MISDLDLLKRWTSRRDAKAYRDIVSRYGSMVYDTCRRVFDHAAEAQDVNQECFERLTNLTPARNPILFSLLICAAITIGISSAAQEPAHYMIDPPITLHDLWVDPGGGRPEVLSDGENVWIAVWRTWMHPVTSDISIHAVLSRSADNGATWSAPLAIGSHDSLWFPRLATNGTGDWVVVWKHGTRIYFARSTDNGVTWNEEEMLSTFTDGDVLTLDGRALGAANKVPHAATDGTGTWITVWESEVQLGGATGEDLDILFSRSTDNGATWSNAALLNTNGTTDPPGRIGTGGDRDARIMTNGAGVWITVWRSSELGIVSARSIDNGQTWSDPEPFYANFPDVPIGHSSFEMKTDRMGGWVAVWSSTFDPDGTAGDDTDIFVTHSTDDGLTWSYPALLNTTATIDFDPEPTCYDDGYFNTICYYNDQDWSPHLTANHQGSWLVVWNSNWNLHGIAGDDKDLFFAQSTDNGATWTDPKLFSTGQTTYSYEHAAMNQAGDVVVVWEGHIPGQGRDIYAARGIAGAALSAGGGGSGGGGCFIATAAYGTPMAHEIGTLRAFRDTYLLNTILGAAFVDTYYRTSPAIAAYIAERPALGAVTRLVLTPIVILSNALLTSPFWTAIALFMITIAIALVFGCRRSWRGWTSGNRVTAYGTSILPHQHS